MLAFDRKTGKLLGSTLAYEGGFLPKNGKNTHASATPAFELLEAAANQLVGVEREGRHD